MLLETVWVDGNRAYLISVPFIDPQPKPVVSKNPEYCRSKQQQYYTNHYNITWKTWLNQNYSSPWLVYNYFYKQYS